MEPSISPCLDNLYPFDTDTIGGSNDNPSEISVTLIPCSTCNRTFASKALQKHARICEKAANKKRKVFDSSRQRREGTELASYPLPKGYGLPPIRQERAMSPKPMQQQHHQNPRPHPHPHSQPHQQPISPKKQTEMITKNSLRSSIRKEAAGANSKSTPSLSGGPSTASITKERSRVSVVKRIQPPSSEQCPYCDRNFGIKAYDRHVEWCKEKSLIASIKSNNTNSRVKAKERLEARTKYKAPSLKSKRSVNRDKYSGVCDLDDDNESQFDDNSKFNISSSMTSSVMSDRNLKLSPDCMLQPQTTTVPARSTDSLRSRNSHRLNENRKRIVTAEEDYDVIEEMKYRHSQEQNYDDDFDDDDENACEHADDGIAESRSIIDYDEDDCFEDAKGYEEYQRRNNEQLLESRRPSSTTSLSPIHRKTKNRHAPPSHAREYDSYDTQQPKCTLNSSMSMPTMEQTIFESTSLTNLENQKARKMSERTKKRHKESMKTVQAAPLIKERIEFFSGGLAKSNDSDSGGGGNSRGQILKQTAEDSFEPPVQLQRNKSFIMSKSVLSDKYDPFLSAKRQLEELCSPTTPTDLLAPFTTSTPSNSNSNTKSILSPIISPLKMTSSLTSACNPNLNPLTSSPNPRRTLTTVKSNFRRTNSLRATSHKPSMLSSRPLFIPPYKQRPTIQRGLSDEGPISSSFLKPEEYDEMPVRSVCVNDFAISNSPRIVRRDTSVSNRKNNMRLPVGSSSSSRTNTNTNNTGHNSIAANANCSGKDESSSSTASKFLSKTDSLAAFLRYENEVENSVNMNSGSSGPLITKELKDKSNALSKQNSAKSIQSEAPEFFKSDEKKTSETVVRLSALKTQRVFEKVANASSQTYDIPSKLNGIRLEPLTKPSFSPVSNEINSLFGETSNSNTQSLSNDRNNSSSSEFIDPKLINICDNLPMNIDSSLSNASKNSDTDSSIEFALSKTNPLSSDCSDRDRKEDDDGDSSLSPTGNSNKITLTGGVDGGGNNCNRNSSEGRNFLKRKMRLGRNQFLYDASPDADYCSADDEANRSSMECDDKLFNLHGLRGHKNSTDGSSVSGGGVCDLPPISSSIPPIPIFDDFDFEEFLSSFENDEDQFPLFKDCREFLINRTSNKSNRATKNIESTQNTNNNTNFLPQSQQQSQTQMSHFHKNFIPSSQIPSQSSCSSSSLRSPTTINDSSSSSRTENDLEHEDKKREIFISIETDQMDLSERHHGGDDGSRDADSLRMAGNSQAHVEEVDPNDNKFRKILDEDYRNAGDTIRVGGGSSGGSSRNREFIPSSDGSSTLPNVKLNNAKNLIKQIHDDFRQMAKTKGNDRTNRDRDSDEMNSSVECFPISASSSRRGGGDSVVTKTCADSAYGSLSRQRSSELSQRHHSRNRPLAGSTITIPSLDAQQKLMQQNQANLKYSSTTQSESKKYHSQQFSGSSSGSENSFPPINVNQQMSQHHSNQHYNNSNREQTNCNTTNSNNNNQRFQRSYEINSKNNNHSPLSSPSPTMAAPSSAPYQSLSRTPSNLSGSMKLSRFCHECGSKFLIEQAKFCMECGVKRIAL